MPFEAKWRLSHPGSAKSDAVTWHSHSSVCHGRGNGQLLVCLRSQRSTWAHWHSGPSRAAERACPNWHAESSSETSVVQCTKTKPRSAAAPLPAALQITWQDSTLQMTANGLRCDLPWPSLGLPKLQAELAKRRARYRCHLTWRSTQTYRLDWVSELLEA